MKGTIGELTGRLSWVIDVRHLMMQEVLPVERLFATRSGAGSRLAPLAGAPS
ncbi:hypothetical protein [Nitrosococcus oceani]|uniref:hypothetical protein n=1 Tax=Nitrosococcus oceani TaxID=1229 RepID=UPI0012DD78B6|nr:hypothetical protein [Nitrosococcus oceani]